MHVITGVEYSICKLQLSDLQYEKNILGCFKLLNLLLLYKMSASDSNLHQSHSGDPNIQYVGSFLNPIP